jgi:predicted secreted protein
MSASQSPINASEYHVAISTDDGATYDRAGFAVDSNLNAGMSTRETSNKFSAGWRELAEAKREWSVAGSGLVVYDDVDGDLEPTDLFALYKNRTKVKVKFTTANAGDYEYTGNAYLTVYNQDGGTEDNLGYNFTFEGTGPLADTAVA